MSGLFIAIKDEGWFVQVVFVSCSVLQDCSELTDRDELDVESLGYNLDLILVYFRTEFTHDD